MSTSGGGSGGSAAATSPSAAKSKKSKKKATAKAQANGDANGHETEGVAADKPESAEVAENGGGADGNGEAASGAGKTSADEPPRSPQAARSRAGTASKADANGELVVRLDKLQQEHTALQEEAARLRKELQEAQSGQSDEAEAQRTQLKEAQDAKEQAEANYQTLMGRVNMIKVQLGERLKEGAEELSRSEARVEELEKQNAQLAEQDSEREAELAKLAEENEAQSKELSGLRNRAMLSSQNWDRERDDLARREAHAREEFESAKQAMQDWEILAMEERSIREGLGERIAELEEQTTTHREARERLEAERESQNATVDGLQRALQELQEARKQELREVVENSQAQLDNIRKELESAQAQAAQATAAQDSMKADLERLLPLEAEVKEKSLQIGKLRHQAVGLNEHLAKALRQINRRGQSEDNISRELVTNHLLKFLTMERSDPRKFQVLQILAATLHWTEEQQESAGLARPGASNPNLRVPISAWHRTPSMPSLTDELEDKPRSESMGSAFAEFLEKESEAGTPRTHSRSPSEDKK